MSAPHSPTAAPETSPVGEHSGWSGGALLALGLGEVRKVLSTRAWWALLVVAAGLCLIITFIPAKVGGLLFTPSAAQALALRLLSPKFTAVLGIVVVTAEFQHRTITTSFLTAPGRAQLMLAKTAVATLFGLGYGVVCAVCGLLGMLVGGGGSALADEFGTVVELSVVAVFVYGLWAALGCGVGMLLRNQLVAVLAIPLYLIAEEIVEQTATLTGSGHIEDYTLGGSAAGAISGLAASPPFSASASDPTGPWWLEFMLFLGYVAVLVAGGVAVSRQRDIT